MKVYRLTKKKYSKILSGKGASYSNNRWNSKGTEIIYTAESRALALAEMAVHLSVSALPDNYAMMEIEIPDHFPVLTLESKDLPDGWNSFPHLSNSQEIGDMFIASSTNVVLKVPSAVVHGDFNFLLNPHHHSFHKIKIIQVTDFPIDTRLIN
ncbi:MAG: RES family NAD+ phosphorylase [Cyclobacteriaceae bacterium]